ncbi:MAG: hypothetical protein JWQ43_3663 [Glaciihabitans sp.]|nr:hypothetical protein [Glaciihabitans sp.]
MTTDLIDPAARPSGTGCLECESTGSWWFHLRRCAACGHIGCCDDSLNKHAAAHFRETGHPVIQSFEPGEDWFWDWQQGAEVFGPPLAPPTSHPTSQTVPGPAERVPRDWEHALQNAAQAR